VNIINQKEKDMDTMKQTAVMITVLVFLLGVGNCFAESAIPNLVGTWTVKAEGGVLLKSSTPGAKTHHTAEFGSLNAEAVVTKQQGRILYGTFKSAKVSENFIAAIGQDNKSFYYADEDGTLEGKIVSKDKMEVSYRHVTTSDSVVAVGTWTREK
jgi:hypothetical protein